MYGRLLDYKKQHGFTCVPQPYKADPQLSLWVSNQRTNYNTNSSNLTAERKHQLNSIDFAWDPFEAQWMEMNGQIVAYKEKYGSTYVPIKYKANLRLGQWVSNQRRRKSKLTADRRNRLNSIDFTWDQFDAQWMEMYEAR